MNTIRLLLCTSLLIAATSQSQITPPPTKPPAKKRAPSPSLAPVEDVAGLPRVLLIGDSISMGYTIPVRELLKGKANLHRIPTNGGPTITGLAHLQEWLGSGKWDVIHFNWGLHDVKFIDGKHQVSIEDYEKNLRELVKQLKATGATLIWCSTTPVPEGSPGRTKDDELPYNAVARKIMEENKIPIDDLYAHALPALDRIQLPKNVHYSSEGYDYLAKQVAASVEKRLPASKPASGK